MLALLTTALLAAPQTYEVLVEEGDVVTGVGEVRVPDLVRVNDRGDWVVSADLELPGSTGFGDFALIGPNGAIVAPGVDLEGMPGITADLYDDLLITDEGEVVSIATLINAPIAERRGLLIGDRVVRQSGFDVGAAGVPAGSTWSTLLFRIVGGSEGRVQMVGEMFPGGTQPDAHTIIEYTVDGSAVIAGEKVVTQGDPLGGTLGNAVRSNPLSVSPAGHRMFAADATGAGGVVLLLDAAPLAIEGDESVVPGRHWTSILYGSSGSVNSHGEYVFATRLDGDEATQDVIVKNGALFRQLGDTLPAIAPHTIERFTVGAFTALDPVQMSETGAVLWAARWNDPEPGTHSGLFVDDRLIVEFGETTIGNRTIISASPGSARISPSGRFVVFIGFLRDSGLADRAAILVDLSEGQFVCDPAVVNSTGVPARIFTTAPIVDAGEPLTLVATDVPRDRMGYFVASPSPGFAINPGGSQGILCVGQPVGRYVGQAMSSGAGGYLSAIVDTNAMPLTPNRPIAGGETWVFQAWFRDANPQPTSNFTPAVAVTF